VLFRVGISTHVDTAGGCLAAPVPAVRHRVRAIMAEVVQLGDGRTGKVREFWSGFWLAAVTLGFYEVWWYYRLNVELRAIGCVLDDERLGRTLPGLSVTAIVLGLLPSVPGVVPWPVGVAALVAFAVSFVSQHRFGRRIRRAEELIGIPERERFGRWSILLLFPGALLVIPYFIWFANVTRHQSALVEIGGNLGRPRAPVAT
jgi:Domain of unknown function (DUF4234)